MKHSLTNRGVIVIGMLLAFCLALVAIDNVSGSGGSGSVGRGAPAVAATVVVPGPTVTVSASADPAPAVTVSASADPAPAVVPPLKLSGDWQMPVFQSHVSDAIVGYFKPESLGPVCWDKPTGRLLVELPAGKTVTVYKLPQAWIEYPDTPPVGSVVYCD